MSTKGNRELIWLGLIMGGVLVALAAAYVRNVHDSVEQIASISERIELIQSLRLALAATSEAQNSAVMATREHDSKSFIEEAHVENAAFDRGRMKLSNLVKQRGAENEVGLIEKVDQTFREFQRIDNQLLDLAIQNSNRKAYDLAFGPARKALQEFDEELLHLIAEQGNSVSERNFQVLNLANDARIRGLRIQLLLLPHIAESSDQKMDELEAQMAEEDQVIRQNLELLTKLLSHGDSTGIAKITSRYYEFEETRTRIINLSRENTDIRSVAIALNEKRKAMLACEDALAALENTIRSERIATTLPSGRGR